MEILTGTGQSIAKPLACEGSTLFLRKFMIDRRQFISATAAAATASLWAQANEWGGPVLDIHLHLRPDGESNVAHINGSGVTKAVLLTRVQLVDQSKALAEKHPGRFVWFVSADLQKPESPVLLTKAVKDGALGLGEIKNQVECDGPEMKRMYALAADLNVPIQIHFGDVPQASGNAVFNGGFKRFDAMLKALRDMEQTVLTSGNHSDTEGIVLRYGIFYGPDVPHTQMFTRLVKWCAMPVVTGDGIVSWIHIDDVAKATAAAVDKGRGGQIYNIVDDRPQSFGDYVRELSAELHRPKPLPIPRRLFGLVAPYGAIAFGDTWLPLSNAKAKSELGWTPSPSPR